MARTKSAAAKAQPAPAAKAVKEAARFSKSQLRDSRRFEKDRDLIDALLLDGRSYSAAEAQAIIDDYKKGEVN